MENKENRKRKPLKEGDENAKITVFGHEVTTKMLFVLRLTMAEIDEILGLYGISATAFSEQMGHSNSWWAKRRTEYAAQPARLSFFERIVGNLDYPRAFLECAAHWIEREMPKNKRVREYFEKHGAGEDEQSAPPGAPQAKRDDKQTDHTTNNNEKEGTDDE